MNLIETLHYQGYLFFIKHPESKGSGTLLFKGGKYTYLPEYARGFEINKDRVIEILSRNN